MHASRGTRTGRDATLSGRPGSSEGVSRCRRGVSAGGVSVLAGCQCQRVVSEKPAMMSAKPTARFQLPMLGIGYWDCEM